MKTMEEQLLEKIAEENLQTQADIVECVVDEYNTYIGG